MLQNDHCQVLVAGSGPAGLAAAIALAERQVDVVVIDPDHNTPALSRCEMLPSSAREILKRLGISTVLGEAVNLQGVVSLWDHAEPINHGAAMPGLSGFGWSVDRSILDVSLRNRAHALGVRFQQGRVRQIEGESDDWHVTLAYKKIQTARYLIDATGRPAVMARRLGAKTTFGPDLIAITCNIEHPVPANLLAEARPEGWWYALPRNHNNGSIGFLTAGTRTNFDAEFITKASQNLRLVPKLNRVSDIYISDSRMSRLFPTISEGWLATGDAAVAFDPIASQGLFNALSSGFFAGNAAADTVAGDQDAVHIYAALVDRTALRTHQQSPHQYAARPFDTAFWNGLSHHNTALTQGSQQVSPQRSHNC